MQRQWRTTTALCVALIIVIMAAGCGGGDSSTATSSTQTYSSPVHTVDATVVSGTTDSHDHTVTVLAQNMDNPPAAGVQYTTSTSASHEHVLVLTQAQLTTISTGGTVTVNSTTVTNPETTASHFHQFIMGKYVTFTSGVIEAHSHLLSINPADLSSPSQNGAVYVTSLGLNHYHTVTITYAQLSALNSGSVVTVTSSATVNPTTGSAHTHDFELYKVQ